MTKLNAAEIDFFLEQNASWRLEAGALMLDKEFKDFVEAMSFVNRVACLAEEQGHHPDIDIRYNKVRLSLVSHDAGGLTERDTALASLLRSII